MSFDALTLSAVRQEIRGALLGGQIQKVIQSGPLEIGLEVYAKGLRRTILCSAQAERARVVLVEERPVRESDTPGPLLLLLRKYVRDGRLISVEQPDFERLLVLRISKRDDEGFPTQVELIIETMGRRSNVILVGPDGAILDALRRAGPARNPRRPVLPHLRYQPPPAQQRLDPRSAESYTRLAELATADPSRPLDELLARQLAGFSPLAAREAAFRAVGRAAPRTGEADWTMVERAVRGLLEHGAEPTIALRDDEVVAFAAYRLTHLADCELRQLPSISQVVELGLASGGGPRRAPPARQVLLDQVDSLLAETDRKLAALERARATAEAADVLRQAGESVLANLTAITAGQTSLEFGGQCIDLDPRLSPLENAQRLFREYRKARDAGRHVPALQQAAELRRRLLLELRVLAELAESPGSQRALREELAELAGSVPPSASARKTGKPHRPSLEGRVQRARSPDGLEVLVGTSSRGNETVTFKLAGPDDLWLHARGVPGAHVILRTGGREPTSASLMFAARLAARHSQSRDAGRVEVDYTARKHVRKVPAGAVGLVTYQREKTLAVSSG